eukprot:SAG31_NODE_478_length_15144_cov_15.165769_17_plen_49_part_00
MLEYAPAAIANDRLVVLAAVAADGNRLALATPGHSAAAAAANLAFIIL